MREFLSQKGVAFEVRDFFQQRFSPQELRELLGERSPSEVFASRSPSVKALGLKGKDLTEEEKVEWIVREPRLLRRPLVQVGERLIVVANWKELDEALQ